MRRRTLLAAAPLALAGCAQGPSGLPPPPGPTPPVPAPVPTPVPAPVPAATGDVPPPLPREFRAAWVATVSNIDWPSRPGLQATALRAEALAILDRARAIGLNALILQVRPAADAIYPSALEPWSEYLSGEQGRAPWAAGEPAWDPLAFWVAEAHRRGLELHAWFNPYRARHSAAKSPLAALHLALRRPELVRSYGDMLWMDPGEPEAAAHTLAVVADVLRRYEVDGVHIDDYFYPYPVVVDGVDQPFPDDEAYANHRLAGGVLSREDWRRANVDELVRSLYEMAHAIRPAVRVGVSPFGIGRPERRPAGIGGFSQYDRIYADVERWLEQGWLDYLAPQLYWPIDRAGQEFGPLLDYWIGANRQQRHLWPGLFTSQIAKAGAPRGWPARELLDQVALQRSRAGSSGHIHFSMAALMQDREAIATLLQRGPYAQPALVPATPWLGAAAPAAPALRAEGGRLLIEPGAGAPVARWAVWRREAASWRLELLPAAERQVEIAGADLLVAMAVGRTGLASAASTFRPTRPERAP